MKVQLYKIVAWLIICLSGCAIQQPPDGGDKDVTPPSLVKATPANFSTNVKPREIIVEFDELIVLKDPLKELSISPFINGNVNVVSSKRNVTIKLPDSLRDNTTYTLNFGRAITDLHEGNTYSDWQYVFSTGATLDSLALAGTIMYATNNKPCKECMAMLYRNIDDTAVFTARPDYYAPADSSGGFMLNNLSAGTYKLYGVKDLNANYLFDSGDEMIGSNFENITLPTEIASTVKVHTEPAAIPRLKSARKEAPGRVKIVLSAAADSLKINFLDKKFTDKNAHVVISSGHDTAFIFYNDTTTDSVNVVLWNGNKFIDSVSVNVKPGKAELARGMVASLTLFTPTTDGYIELNRMVQLMFSNPIIRYDVSRMVLTKDSMAQQVEGIEFVDSLHFVLALPSVLKPSSNYILTMLPGAFIDINGATHDTLKTAWMTRAANEYGSLSITFGDSRPFVGNVLQLVDDNDVVKTQAIISNKKNVTFEFLLPGKYRLKLIDDANGNGKFDNGNFRKKLLPENVYYHPESVSIRANWDIDLKWE